MTKTHNSRLELNYPENLIYAIFDCKNIEQLKGVMLVLPNDNKFILEKIFNSLDKRLVKIVTLLYKEKLTYENAGKQLVITKERVRQLNARLIKHLRHESRLLKLIIPIDFMLSHETMEKRYEALLFNDKCEACKHLFEFRRSNKNENAMYLPIRQSGMSERACNCLTRAGAIDMKDVIYLYYENKLPKLRNLGENTYNEITNKLVSLGLLEKAKSFGGE